MNAPCYVKKPVRIALGLLWRARVQARLVSTAVPAEVQPRSLLGPATLCGTGKHSQRAGRAKAALALWFRECQKDRFLRKKIFVKAGLSLLLKKNPKTNKQVISSSSLSQHFLANHHWTGRPEGHE